MNVLHVFKYYLPDSQGGIEQTIYHLSKASSRLGVNNSVLSLCHSPEPKILQRDEATVTRCKIQFDKASTPFGFGLLKEYGQCVSCADVVHYHYPYPVQDLLHLFQMSRKPSVVTYHSDIVRQKKLKWLYSPVKRLFLGAVDAIVATSENYCRTSKTLARYPDKVHVIPIGLNRDALPTPDASRTAHWRLRFGEKFFFFIGVLRYYKGLKILMEAARKTKHPIVIAGAGPMETELKEEARKHNMEHVHFLGMVSEEDKAALLAACHAVVFPSHLRSEAFGVTLVEGAMFGKPLISAEIGTGTSFVNSHEETGIVIPPSNPDALAQAMNTLADDNGPAAQYGKNAQARYEQYFTADRMAQMYLELYQKLAKPGAC